MPKNNQQQVNLKARIIVFLIISMIICSTFIFNNKLETWINGLIFPDISQDVSVCELKVHFIDIGQGDSILVELPDNKIMLVDAGPNSGEDNLLTYLNNIFTARQNKNIDYFIVTHQDEDHIGGADKVFDNFNVLTFYRPNVYTDQEMIDYGYSSSEVNTCNTVVFKTMIAKMNAEGCSVFVNTKSSNPFGLGSECEYTIEFLSPKDTKYTDPNNYSPITIISYKNRKIMLTGDAEKLVEKQVLSDYSEDFLACDILKLGHHGSDTSTSKEFLDAVNPKYIAISCGLNNKYKHPTESVLARVITKVGEGNVYRTDMLGNVVFGLDKDNLVSGKAQIMIAHQKGQVIKTHIAWWYVVVSAEVVLFMVVFLPNYLLKSVQPKKSKKKK